MGSKYRSNTARLALGIAFWNVYTLFQNGHHFSILLFSLKLALVASFWNSKFKRIFYLKRGNKGLFVSKQKDSKIAAILE